MFDPYIVTYPLNLQTSIPKIGYVACLKRQPFDMKKKKKKKKKKNTAFILIIAPRP